MSWNALTTTILYSYSLIPCQKFYYNSGNIKTETRVLAILRGVHSAPQVYGIKYIVWNIVMNFRGKYNLNRG